MNSFWFGVLAIVGIGLGIGALVLIALDLWMGLVDAGKKKQS